MDGSWCLCISTTKVAQRKSVVSTSRKPRKTMPFVRYFRTALKGARATKGTDVTRVPSARLLEMYVLREAPGICTKLLRQELNRVEMYKFLRDTCLHHASRLDVTERWVHIYYTLSTVWYIVHIIDGMLFTLPSRGVKMSTKTRSHNRHQDYMIQQYCTSLPYN